MSGRAGNVRRPPDWPRVMEKIDVDQGAGSVSLNQFLGDWGLELATRKAIVSTVIALAEASSVMANRVAKGAIPGRLGRVTARAGEFDEQKEIDVLANNEIIEALRPAPVAAVASEELEEPVVLDAKAPLLVAVDPLDGSSNVEANVSFGMIFSVLPSHPTSVGVGAFLRPGSHQLAAGIIIYGPATILALTVGSGTHVFTLDRETGTFLLTQKNVAIPSSANEYAINASNARYWEEPIRIYVHDCENGAGGPRGREYNMRWTGSPVADVYRILSRGGIYLYPADSRKGFHQGRIRLIYEASPIAWLVEQAGGRATTGRERILDVVPATLHQKSPLICGSREEVDHVVRLYNGESLKGQSSPLFGRRGLFRAWN